MWYKYRKTTFTDLIWSFPINLFLPSFVLSVERLTLSGSVWHMAFGSAWSVLESTEAWECTSGKRWGYSMALFNYRHLIFIWSVFSGSLSFLVDLMSTSKAYGYNWSVSLQFRALCHHGQVERYWTGENEGWGKWEIPPFSRTPRWLWPELDLTGEVQQQSRRTLQRQGGHHDWHVINQIWKGPSFLFFVFDSNTSTGI